MKKKFTCESFLDFKYVSDPQLSPDGKYTAFLLKTADIRSNSYQTALYLLDNKTGETKQMTSIGPVAAYTWEDEETILFPALRSASLKEEVKKGEERMGYYELPIHGGEAREKFVLPVKGGKALAAGNGMYAVTASWDADRPCTDGMSEAEKKKVLNRYRNRGYEHIREIPFTLNGAGYVNRKRNRIYLFDSRTNGLKAVTGEMFHVAGMKVRGDQILYVGQEFQDIRSLKNGVYLYDAAAGTHKCLLEPEQFLVKGFELYKNQVILNLTDGASYGNGENGDFYSIDVETGERRLLARHQHRCIGNTVTSDVKLGAGQTTTVDGSWLYYTSTTDMDCIIERLNLETGEIQALTESGSVDFLDVRDGKLVCTAFTGVRLPEVYELRDGCLYQKTHLNDFVLEEYEISKPEYMEAAGSAPWPIHGCVLKPAGYEPGRKYPGILAIHGGPRLTYGPVFMHQMQMFAAEGYFVFFCNPRGAEGRGNEFGDIRKRFGSIDFDDFMEFTDEVLRKYPDIDRKRLAVEGGSYGGFMTNWIIGHTDRFAAACSQRSISNWTGMEGTTDIGYYFCKGQTGASHMEDHSLQWQQSPLKTADKCKTPTLFIHGECDYRCFMQEAFQMYAALKLHGCPAKLCLFQGENHELSRSGRPKQRLQRLIEMSGWFRKYMQSDSDGKEAE